MDTTRISTHHARLITVGLLSLALLLSGCSSLSRTGKRAGKIPANLTVSSGPNRDMAVYAMKYLGTPYVYGGTTPDGFDCSGLVQYSAKRALSVKLPRRAVEQATTGTVIPLSEAKAGDLLFFNTDGQPYSHVGIYLGQTYFIHSPSSNGVVRIEDYQVDYWRKRFTLAKRVK